MPIGHQSSHNRSDLSYDDDSLGNTGLKQPNVPGAEFSGAAFFSIYFSYSGEHLKYCFGELFLLSEEEEQQQFFDDFSDPALTKVVRHQRLQL